VIVYEVRVEVEPEIAEAYHDWLVPHVHEILAIPGFAGAELFREDPDGPHPVFTVRYHLDTHAALEAYLRDHAVRLRADAEARFGTRFRATRRVMELVRSFGAGRR
jgi:antibiotic biosynthesis monooxygenase (ABM) superfamily enzyme